MDYFTEKDFKENGIDWVMVQDKVPLSDLEVLYNEMFDLGDQISRKKRKKRAVLDHKGPKTQLFPSGITVHMGKTTVHSLLDKSVLLYSCSGSFDLQGTTFSKRWISL